MPLTPKITYQIPPQNFELVRDRIGGILLCEFGNQATNYSLPAACTPTAIDIERFVQIDEDSFPIVTVRTAKGSYLDDEGKQTKESGGNVFGVYKYYIDIYTGSPSTPGEGGDQLASVNLQRMMGIARAVLEDTRYDTLGFDPKTSGLQIQNVHVENFFINLPANTGDAIDYICGRLVLSVKVPETVQLPAPGALAIAFVTVGLFKTGNTIKWQFLQQQISIVASGTTLTNAFFSNSINSIDVIVAGEVKNTYLLNKDFTQAGTTITATTFTFTNGQTIIAKTT